MVFPSICIYNYTSYLSAFQNFILKIVGYVFIYRAFGSKIYKPVELAEKFSDVYDNQWIDALEELFVKIKNEKAVIQILLHIVMVNILNLYQI